MASLPRVGFHPPEMSAGIVAHVENRAETTAVTLFIVRTPILERRAVVRRKNHECPLFDPRVVQCCKDFSDPMVDLLDEIAVTSGATSPFELRRRGDGRVGSRQADHQEEWSVAVLPDVFHRFAGLRSQQFFGLPRLCHDSRNPGHSRFERAVRNFWKAVPASGFSKAVVLNEGIGREVGHVISVIVVEPMMRGAVLQRLRIVDIGPVRGSVDRNTVGGGETDP